MVPPMASRMARDWTSPCLLTYDSTSPSNASRDSVERRSREAGFAAFTFAGFFFAAVLALVRFFAVVLGALGELLMPG